MEDMLVGWERGYKKIKEYLCLASIWNSVMLPSYRVPRQQCHCHQILWYGVFRQREGWKYPFARFGFWHDMEDIQLFHILLVSQR